MHPEFTVIAAEFTKSAHGIKLEEITGPPMLNYVRIVRFAIINISCVRFIDTSVG